MSNPSSLPHSHTPVPGPGGTALGAECTYSRSAEAPKQMGAGAMHGSAVAGQIHAQGAPSGTMTINTPKDSGDNHEPQERNSTWSLINVKEPTATMRGTTL